MANTLTNLMPDLYQALDVISRELVGFIPAVTSNTGIERAALNENVRSFVVPSATVGDITPAVTSPDDGNQTIGNVVLQITKARRAPFRWNGEETRGMNNGPGFEAMKVAQIAQAMRSLTNEVETDLAVALATAGSRAYGTAGTINFNTTLGDPAQVRKILSDNGAPLTDLQMVIDTGAGAAMRTLAQLTKANEAADTTMLRQGVLLDIHGFAIRESGKVSAPAIGTAANATTNAAGYAVGATAITLAAVGTGTLIPGDIITFANDTTIKYVVANTVAAVSGGALIIAAPGLVKALPASTQAIAVIASSPRNVGFAKTSIVLATRLPALPDGGDLAIDRTTVTDPKSGLSFEVAMYPQYRQMQYEVSLAWGCKAVKSEHIAIMYGA